MSDTKMHASGSGEEWRAAELALFVARGPL
jgi:hypothetical protein